MNELLNKRKDGYVGPWVGVWVHGQMHGTDVWIDEEAGGNKVRRTPEMSQN